MNQQKLESFLRRIIETSPDPKRAQLAMEQLREILSLQLTEEDLAMFSSALAGVGDSLPEMKTALKDAPAETAPGGEMIRIAAERAQQRRIREEQASARGRC